MGEKKQHIVVLGAGVIGLQTAVTLLEAGCDVTVIAEEWADTAIKSQTWTSPWAGAQWRAHAAGNTAAAGWEAATYKAWSSIHAEEAAAGYANGQGPSSLASITMDNLYSEQTKPKERPPWWSVLDPASFSELPASSLPPGTAYGARMRAFTLEPARHLAWLMQRLHELGGRTIRTRLSITPGKTPLEGVVDAARRAMGSRTEIATFVNALGLGVAKLGIDPSVIPNRGQTVLVKGETDSMRTRIGQNITDVIAIIPRPGTGTTIVGSTRGPGRTDAQEDRDETQWLLRGGREVAPDLFETRADEQDRGRFIRANVGFRPRRGEKGLGARVEKEVLPDHTVVVHAYGHEGAGFQQGVGTALNVCELLGVKVPKKTEVKL